MINLYHGDCLQIMDKLIADGVKVDAVVTDPPYGTTACKWDKIIPFDEMWKRLKLLRKDNTPIVLFSKEPFTSKIITSNLKHFKYRWDWIKDKHSNFALSKYQPLNFIEDVCVFYTHNYYPIMTQGTPNHSVGKGIRKKENKTSANTVTVKNKTDGWKYPRNYIYFNRCQKNVHPTQKPVELMEYLLKTYTREGDTVLDFTMGSGTTGVACRNLNRNFIGIELDFNYYMTAWERIYDARA